MRKKRKRTLSMNLPSPVSCRCEVRTATGPRSQRVARASTPGKSPTPLFLRGRCGRVLPTVRPRPIPTLFPYTTLFRSLHEPAVPERGSVTRRTWGCSDALRLTEPRSHRVVRFMVPIHAEKTKEDSLHEPAVARELPVRSADRDRSPVAACGPRQHPWKITHALVFARPLRPCSAHGPTPTDTYTLSLHDALPISP